MKIKLIRIKAVLAEAGVRTKTAVTRQVELFVTARQTVITEAELEFDRLHADRAKAALKFKKPHEVSLRTLMDRYCEPLPCATSNTTGGSARKTVTEKSEHGMPIEDYWKQLLSSESSEGADIWLM